MRKRTDKYFLKVLPVRGHAARPNKATINLLRESGAPGILFSDSAGVGVVYMKPAVTAVRKAEQGARFDAIIQRANTSKLYGISNGALFVIEDATAAAEILQATREPVANFEFLEIPTHGIKSPSKETLSTDDQLEAFRASVKRGYRGSDIIDEGHRLSVAELRDIGWESSVRD